MASRRFKGDVCDAALRLGSQTLVLVGELVPETVSNPGIAECKKVFHG